MIKLHERLLPTSAGVEPATSWSLVGLAFKVYCICKYDKVFIYVSEYYGKYGKTQQTHSIFT